MVIAIGGTIFGFYGVLKPAPSCDDENIDGGKDSVGGIAVDDERVLECMDKSTGETAEYACPKCENMTKVFIIPPDEKIIEDTNVINELSKKVSWLNDVYGAGEEAMFIHKPAAYNAIEEALYIKPLSDMQKAVIAAKMAFAAEKKTLGNERDAVLDEIQKHYDSVSPGTYNVRNWTGISFSPYDLANSNYHELFGYENDIPKEYLKGTCAEQYLYLNALDGYTNISDGCGGYGWPVIYVRKDYFTKKNDEAFVYVRVVSHLVEEALCDGYVGREGKSAKSLGCKLDVAEVEISDLDTAAVYKFSFKKNSAGMYSFVEVEKI